MTTPEAMRRAPHPDPTTVRGNGRSDPFSVCYNRFVFHLPRHHTILRAPDAFHLVVYTVLINTLQQMAHFIRGGHVFCTLTRSPPQIPAAAHRCSKHHALREINLIQLTEA